MTESKLNPFDAELLVMIGDIAKSQPEVEEKPDRYEITVDTTEIQGNAIEALKQAVAGRLGKRLLVTHTLDAAVVFNVEYDPTEYPEQIRIRLVEPDATAGTRYCRTLLEVDAIQVRRDNLDDLLRFTGGGTMQVPRTPGGLAVYSFPTEYGVMLGVPEGNFIVLAPDGKFGKMDMQTFMANFEEKDANTAGLTFDEKRLFEKMNKLFGKNIEKRLGKLAEEYNELFEAFERYLSREKTQREINEINPGTHDIIDELADVNVVLFHIAALLGYSQKELQEMAYTKIAGREKNPEFMRKHPHKKPENPVCGNCNNFGNEDINGDGFCNEQNRMRHCSCLACNQWQEKQTAEEYKHFDERFNKRL